LLDEVRLHLVSVLLGAGVRLLDDMGSDPTELKQLEVIGAPDVTPATRCRGEAGRGGIPFPSA
jgi:hypothetical protein